MDRLSRQVSSDFQLTVSVGAATYASVNDGIEAMLQRADNALYAAKNDGRDRVVLAPRDAEHPAIYPEPASFLKINRDLLAKATH